MNKNILTLNRLIEKIYWIFTFLVFAFVSENNEKFVGKLQVFFIPGTKWLVHLFFLVIYVAFFALINRKILIDKIMFFLLLKFLWDIVSTCFINQPESFAFVVWANVGVISYFICKNMKIDIKNILTMYELFALLLSVQTMITTIMLYRNGMTFQSFIFKQQLRIPYAGSNLISCVVASAMICMLARYELKESNIIYVLINLTLYSITILLIRSRGSILILMAVLDWIILKRIRESEKKYLRQIMCLLLIATNIVVVIYAFNSSIVKNYFSRYLSGPNDVTSGRVQIWEFAWNEFLNKPICGRGISYAPGTLDHYTGAHNIILDTMMSSGVVGIMLHATTICMILSKIWIRNDRTHLITKLDYACLMTVAFLYLNSMIEVSYYNYINDCLFWSLCGILMADIRKNKIYINSAEYQSKVLGEV